MQDAHLVNLGTSFTCGDPILGAVYRLVSAKTEDGVTFIIYPI
jgi:hypothetical protein